MEFKISDANKAVLLHLYIVPEMGLEPIYILVFQNNLLFLKLEIINSLQHVQVLQSVLIIIILLNLQKSSLNEMYYEKLQALVHACFIWVTVNFVYRQE